MAYEGLRFTLPCVNWWAGVSEWDRPCHKHYKGSMDVRQTSVSWGDGTQKSIQRDAWKVAYEGCSFTP